MAIDQAVAAGGEGASKVPTTRSQGQSPAASQRFSPAAIFIWLRLMPIAPPWPAPGTPQT